MLLIAHCLSTLAKYTCTSPQIAVDSIDNIRTVAALGVEDNFYSLYCNSLKKPYR